MVKQITAPTGAKYLSDFLTELPHGIFNKGITGCGGTTIALTDKHPTIIAVPRIVLIENKTAQMGDRVLGVFGRWRDNIKAVRAYLERCADTGDAPKIMVTYDSYRNLARHIGDLSLWRVVVDEVHSALSDATFRAVTIIEFLRACAAAPYITYMTATPIPNDINRELKKEGLLATLETTEVVWPEAQETHIYKLCTPQPMEAVARLAMAFKLREPGAVTLEGITPKQLVVFCNSTANIVSVIKSVGLMPEDVNIIASKGNETTAETVKGLSAITSQDYRISTPPQKGEPHKLITFCTSAAYMGADFWGEDTLTVIASDYKTPHTLCDIALQLPQIMGRHRDEHNRLRHACLFIHNDKKTLQVQDKGQERAEVEMTEDTINDKWRIECNLVEVVNNATDEVTGITRNLLKRACKDGAQANDYFIYYDQQEDNFKPNKVAYLGALHALKTLQTYETEATLRPKLIATGARLIPVRDDMSGKKIFSYCTMPNGVADLFKAYCEAQQEGNQIKAVYALAAYQLRQYDPKGRKPLYDFAALYREHTMNEIERAKFNPKRLTEAPTAPPSEVLLECVSKFHRGTELTADELTQEVANLFASAGLSTPVTSKGLRSWFEVDYKRVVKGGTRKRFYYLNKILNT